MIIFERYTKDGVKIPIAIPISNIMEVSPNAYQAEHSWIKYNDGTTMRPMVVVGTVEEIVQRVKQSYMGY